MRTLLALGILIVSACGLEVVGLSEADAQFRAAREVATVSCGADTLVVGQSTDCGALNARGGTIQWASFPGVTWASSDPTVAQVTQDGVVWGQRAGLAIVTAYGARESQASDTLVVVE